MPFYSQRTPRTNCQTVWNTFAQAPGLPFPEVLTAEHSERVAREEGGAFGAAPGSIDTVSVTLWALLAQVLSKQKACVAAVARVMGLRIALGLEPCAGETGA